MRKCPICAEDGRRTIDRNYCAQAMQLHECVSCGFRYVDALDLNQLWFDTYYLTSYKTDDKPYSAERYKSLADFVSKRANDVLDIGGLDGELHEYFTIPYKAVGVNDEIDRQYECVVLSHVLEHVYDVPKFMQRAKSALKPYGFLVVEVPIHIGYNDNYDVHWQHVNKFRPYDLLRLFENNGFRFPYNYQLPDYREYQTWRIAGKMK